MESHRRPDGSGLTQTRARPSTSARRRALSSRRSSGAVDKDFCVSLRTSLEPDEDGDAVCDATSPELVCICGRPRRAARPRLSWSLAPRLQHVVVTLSADPSATAPDDEPPSPSPSTSTAKPGGNCPTTRAEVSRAAAADGSPARAGSRPNPNRSQGALVTTPPRTVVGRVRLRVVLARRRVRQAVVVSAVGVRLLRGRRLHFQAARCAWPLAGRVAGGAGHKSRAYRASFWNHHAEPVLASFSPSETLLKTPHCSQIVHVAAHAHPAVRALSSINPVRPPPETLRIYSRP